MADLPVLATPPQAPVRPFGLGCVSEPLLRSALTAAWAARSHPGFARDLLRHGVCTECSLGSLGARDENLEGIHLCSRRLRALGSWTADGLDPARLPSVTALEALEAPDLRALGRLPVPLLRRAGGQRFTPVSWDDALKLAAARLEEAEEWSLLVDSKEVSNEGLYLLGRAAEFGVVRVGSLRSRSDGDALAEAFRRRLGSSSATCSLSTVLEVDRVVLWGAQIADQPYLGKLILTARKRGVEVISVDAPAGAEGRLWLPSRPHSWLRGVPPAHRLTSAPTGGIRQLLEWLLQVDSVVVLVGPDAQRSGDGSLDTLLSTWLESPHAAQAGSGIVPLGLRPGTVAAEDLGLLRGVGALPPPCGVESFGQVLWAVGPWSGDVSAQSDRLASVGVRIHQGMFLDRAMCVDSTEAVLLLPVQSSHESAGGVTFTSVDRRVRFSPEIRGHSIGTARPDWSIVASILGLASVGTLPDFDDAAAIRELIALQIPRYAELAQLKRSGESFRWEGRPDLGEDVLPVAEGLESGASL